MRRDDDAQPSRTIGLLSDPRLLTGLYGVCKGFDAYVGMVGVDILAAILRKCLREISQRQPALFASAGQLLQRLSDRSIDSWPDTERRTMASLLADIFKNGEVLNEINDVFRKTTYTAMARDRGEGRSSDDTRREERDHEELLKREYSGVEAEVFNRLKNGLRGREDSVAPPVAEGVSISSSEAGMGIAAEHAKSRTRDVGRGQSDGVPETLRLAEMWAMLSDADLSTLEGSWRGEPLRMFLWLAQNGTEEQQWAYIHRNAYRMDDEMKKVFLEALAADETVPIVWKTILVRALSG
jgi:hypothetical protein